MHNYIVYVCFALSATSRLHYGGHYCVFAEAVTDVPLDLPGGEKTDTVCGRREDGVETLKRFKESGRGDGVLRRHTRDVWADTLQLTRNQPIWDVIVDATNAFNGKISDVLEMSKNYFSRQFPPRRRRQNEPKHEHKKFIEDMLNHADTVNKERKKILKDPNNKKNKKKKKKNKKKKSEDIKNRRILQRTSYRERDQKLSGIKADSSAKPYVDWSVVAINMMRRERDKVKFKRLQLADEDSNNESKKGNLVNLEEDIKKIFVKLPRRVIFKIDHIKRSKAQPIVITVPRYSYVHIPEDIAQIIPPKISLRTEYRHFNNNLIEVDNLSKNVQVHIKHLNTVQNSFRRQFSFKSQWANIRDHTFAPVVTTLSSSGENRTTRLEMQLGLDPASKPEIMSKNAAKKNLAAVESMKREIAKQNAFADQPIVIEPNAKQTRRQKSEKRKEKKGKREKVRQARPGKEKKTKNYEKKPKKMKPKRSRAKKKQIGKAKSKKKK